MIPRLLKWGTLAVIIVTLAIAGYWVNLYQDIRTWALRDEAAAADTIVVLGAAQYNGRPSPVFKARLDHALDLHRRGYAHSIITTGGFGPDSNFSEAHVGTQYLIQNGVDEAVIVTEQGSDTTADSIRAVTNLMKAKGWSKALVVSDGFHLYRLKRMLEDSGIVAYTSPAPNSPIEVAETQRFWHSIREVLLFSAYRLNL